MAKFPVIGIDLGTTYSCVGCFKNSQVEIIANTHGKRTTPSIIAYRDNEILVGESARAQRNSNPGNTIFDTKRVIGRLHRDPTIESDVSKFPFKIIADPSNEQSGRAVFQLTKPCQLLPTPDNSQGRSWVAPEEGSAEILKHLKIIAEGFIGTQVKHAVVTVPAYFNNEQREATKRAAEIAGLQLLQMLNEPTAAAIAYGNQNDGSFSTEHRWENATTSTNSKRTILVVDLGGGTFDVSLLELDGTNYKVKAVDGDSHLGGEDFTNKMVDHFIYEFCENNGFDVDKICANSRAVRRIRDQCEQSKRLLSTSTVIPVEIESLYQDTDLFSSITRDTFDLICRDLFDRILRPIETVIQIANISRNQINDIVLIGGATRMPKIQEIVRSYFNGLEPEQTINPDEAVAFGATLLAVKLAQEQAINNESSDFDPVIANIKIPDVTLREVTPMTISVSCDGGIVIPVVPRNTEIPFSIQSVLDTCEDYQETITSNILEGESLLLEKNNLLGTFVISNLSKRLRGEVSVEVTFSMDSNGILKISAVERGNTENTSSLAIENVTNEISTEQRLQMIQDQQKDIANDKAEYNRRIARRDLFDCVHDSKRKMREATYIDNRDLWDEEDKLIQMITSLEAWINTNNDAPTQVYLDKKRELDRRVWKFFALRNTKPANTSSRQNSFNMNPLSNALNQIPYPTNSAQMISPPVSPLQMSTTTVNGEHRDSATSSISNMSFRSFESNDTNDFNAILANGMFNPYINYTTTHANANLANANFANLTFPNTNPTSSQVPVTRSKTNGSVKSSSSSVVTTRQSTRSNSEKKKKKKKLAIFSVMN